MKAFITQATFLCITVLITGLSNAQIVAFPGAEGAGKFTTGGRGTSTTPTTVFEVTNLTDVNAPGSLRYACSQSTSTYPNRTIVFRISGTIHLNSKLGIPQNTTVAGQTAPGGGICLADYPVVINGNNVIVRYIRVRMGDKNQLKTTPAGCGVPVAPFTAACAPVDGSGGDDAFGDLGHKNVIIDHCSISWSTDEAFTFYRGDSLTLQWNFIEEPLNYSYHFETGDADFEHHGYGAIWGSRHGTFHHNLFAHCQSRNPRFGGNTTYAGDIESADFRNNVIYNWGLYTVYGGEGGQYNLVNNYYRYGPSTGSGTRYRIVNVDSNAAYGYAHYYLSGNYVDGSTTNTNNNWLGAFINTGNIADSVKSKVTTPFLTAYLPSNTDDAVAAYNNVLQYGGASLPIRDTLDERIVQDVKLRRGRIIDVQGGYPHATPYAQTVNAWPTLNSTTAPTDTDHDGMPDDWENANSLNPNNAADRQAIAANGYTNLENYLNSLTLANSPLPVHLINFSVQSALNKNTLVWNVTNQTNLEAFEVEQSGDGTNFRPIGKVNALNATTSAYSFVDHVNSNIIYYRLKLVNKDGSYSYSFVITVRRSAGAALSLYPNPAKDVVTLTHGSSTATQQLQVLRVDGILIQQIAIPKSATQTTINIGFLQPGIYILRYINGSSKTDMKLMKL